jgi:hypothetical protein
MVTPDSHLRLPTHLHGKKLERIDISATPSPSRKIVNPLNQALQQLKVK